MRLGLSTAAVVAAAGLVLGACNGAAEDTTTTGEATATTEAETTTSPVETGQAAEVIMESISFQPDEITVPAGATVTWTNEDGVSHTTTSDDDVWDSGQLTHGDSFEFTFDEPGTYSYTCRIHPGQMQATVVVEG